MKDPKDCYFCQHLRGIGLCHLHRIKWEMDKDGIAYLKPEFKFNTTVKDDLDVLE